MKCHLVKTLTGAASFIYGFLSIIIGPLYVKKVILVGRNWLCIAGTRWLLFTGIVSPNEE
jgi:hypothetical protein